MTIKWEDIPLDRKSYIPLYAQIHERVSSRIKAGVFSVGDLLPSENELASFYDVSRMTCRQALQLLTTQGYLTRVRGAGSIVALPKVDKDIAHLQGFSAEIRAMGGQPSSQVLNHDVIAASQHVASCLNIQAGDPVFRLVRLRFADNVVLALEETNLPLKRFIGIEKKDFSRNQSLYQVMTETFGIRLLCAEETIEARIALRKESRALDLKPGGAVLVMERILFDVEDKPIEWARSVYRGDRYRAKIQISL